MLRQTAAEDHSSALPLTELELVPKTIEHDGVVSEGSPLPAPDGEPYKPSLPMLPENDLMMHWFIGAGGRPEQ